MARREPDAPTTRCRRQQHRRLPDRQHEEVRAVSVHALSPRGENLSMKRPSCPMVPARPRGGNQDVPGRRRTTMRGHPATLVYALVLLAGACADNETVTV